MLNCCNNEKRYYKVYGLSVMSEIVLKELIELPEHLIEDIDVKVRIGVVPEEISGTFQSGDYYKISNKEMIIYVKGTASYYISEGNNIIIQPEENSREEDIKIYLLGSAFGALLFQREMVAIHGAAIAVNDKSFILTGDSGAGKSTLTYALITKGYKFLADDVSVIGDTTSKAMCVYPSYPQQKLSSSVLSRMGHTIDKLLLVDEERDKYAVPLISEFLEESVPLSAIFELKVGEVPKVTIEMITGSEKLIALLKNIYRIEFAWHNGIKPSYFKKCVEITKATPFYRITRPKNRYSVDEEIKSIADVLNYFKQEIV